MPISLTPRADHVSSEGLFLDYFAVGTSKPKPFKAIWALVAMATEKATNPAFFPSTRLSQ